MSAGLNFEKQVFCVKCGTPLLMSYLLQTSKTNNLLSNTNRQVASLGFYVEFQSMALKCLGIHGIIILHQVHFCLYVAKY